MTDYQCKLSPETEFIYSEISVCCLATKVRTINLGEKHNNMYVVSERKIQPPTTLAGQAESEVNVFVVCILNHHHYPLKFQRGLC
jgi:hypothetical protein